MIFSKKIRNNFYLIITVCAVMSCGKSICSIFVSNKVEDKFNLRIIDDTLNKTHFNLKECECSVFSDQIIELSFPIQDSIINVREYYGEQLYAIGRKKGEIRIDEWKTFCNGKLIAEELWFNGKIVWYRFINNNGEQTEKVYFGIEEEDF